MIDVHGGDKGGVIYNTMYKETLSIERVSSDKEIDCLVVYKETLS